MIIFICIIFSTDKVAQESKGEEKMSPPLFSFVNLKDRGDQHRKKVAQESKGEEKMSQPLSSFVNIKDRGDQQRKKVAHESEGEGTVSPPLSSFVIIVKKFVIVKDLNVHPRKPPKKLNQESLQMNLLLK